jgi:hypothetical protein
LGILRPKNAPCASQRYATRRLYRPKFRIFRSYYVAFQVAKRHHGEIRYGLFSPTFSSDPLNRCALDVDIPTAISLTLFNYEVVPCIID